MPSTSNPCEPGPVSERYAIRQDFNRIAAVAGEGWDHNSHYHPTLSLRVPPGCRRALDIGCGTGEFTRLLAGRSERVTGFDLSPVMIDVARQRSAALPNIEYLATDVMEHEFPEEQYDCIASIATMHHLPLDFMLQKIKRALAPGGVLLVLDLYQHAGIKDLLLDLAAMPAGVYYRVVRTGRLMAQAAERQAWQAHGVQDSYLPLKEIRRLAAYYLPGVEIEQHLIWRYSLLWNKPLQSDSPEV